MELDEKKLDEIKEKKRVYAEGLEILNGFMKKVNQKILEKGLAIDTKHSQPKK